MSDESLGNEYLDCPMCGDGVDVLTWEPPSAAWPLGAWVGRDGDMATCETCGWRVMVSCDGEEPPHLIEIACPHKREPQAGCWRCDVREALGHCAWVVRRWAREAWCGLLRRHVWVKLQGAGSYCDRCEKSRLL